MYEVLSQPPTSQVVDRNGKHGVVQQTNKKRVKTTRECDFLIIPAKFKGDGLCLEDEVEVLLAVDAGQVVEKEVVGGRWRLLVAVERTTLTG